MSHIRIPHRPGKQILDLTGVPPSLRGKVSAVVRNQRDAEQLVRFYGSPDYAPIGPLLIMIEGYEAILIAGEGRLRAIKLRDMAGEIVEKMLEEAIHDGEDGRMSGQEIRDLPGETVHATLRRSLLQKAIRRKDSTLSNPPVVGDMPVPMRKLGRDA